MEKSSPSIYRDVHDLQDKKKMTWQHLLFAFFFNQRTSEINPTAENDAAAIPRTFSFSGTIFGILRPQL